MKQQEIIAKIKSDARLSSGYTPLPQINKTQTLGGLLMFDPMLTIFDIDNALAQMTDLIERNEGDTVVFKKEIF